MQPAVGTVVSRWRAPLRSAAFAAVFAGAVLLGRLTVMDGTSLSLVWPAAGVAAAWFAVQRDAGTRPLDVALLAVITWSLNVATGTGAVLAVFFVAANLVQVEVFVVLLRRWCPGLWGSGGSAPLTGTRTLARLLAAAVVATAAGALVGPTAAALDTGRWSWLVVAVWLVRNTVAVLLVTVAALRLGHVLGAVAGRAGQGPRATADALPRQLPFLVPRGWQALELAAAVLASALAYGAVFWFAHGLPLAFLPLSLTVWVALRFDTTLVAVHGVVVSSVAVVCTLAGGGPFALIATDATRALVVQAYVGLLAVIGLMLAVSRDEREVLVRRLRGSETRTRELLDQVRLRADFADTVLATADVGVAVCDADGRLTLLNDTARTWFGLRPDDDLDTAGPALDALVSDGSALRRALAEGRVEGLELLVAPPGRPPVPVTCSARRMSASDGTHVGAVVALHDLRGLRSRESALAAANDRLREHSEHLERLAHASRAVLTSEDPRRAVCEAALDIGGAFSVTLWQPDTARQRFVATASAADGDSTPVATLRLDHDGDRASSLVSACYQAGEAIFLADAARHPLASPLIAEVLGDASGVWLPVPDPDGGVAGVLVVLWTQRVAVLPAATSALLTALAGEAAHAFDRADLVARLDRAAGHDALTGLANRRRWDEAAAAEIARAARTGDPVTFALIDLDHFKAYNDTRGHLAGDALLAEFARRAPEHLREGDVLARWGGEEFAVALPGCTAEQARTVADRIRADVPDGQTCSIGVCQWQPGASAEQVMAEADAALYRAKHQGRDQTVLAGSEPSLSRSGAAR
ncbi:diguanylate cyclase domain-containing protein [Kineococcus rubinsiae]|uniref:diguanylate cyclase domain-containing protein n=1 Tax=Kineococcus rubinsiae TaxID=2609562 RepID=UPI00143059E4|nr:diguanylate cyclase [Kineococcus rubinsiae]NIZ90118.1 diguanylate cyclase [Kineococcus rubinsiae]